MRRILGAVAVAALLAGCSNAQGSVSGERAAAKPGTGAQGNQPQEGVAIDGYFLDLSPAEYFDQADTVIRGTVIDGTTRRLDVPSDSDLFGADEQLAYIDVHEVLDGSAPASLTISRAVSSDTLRVDLSQYQSPLDQDQEYVFVLRRGSAATGSDGDYTFLGEHAAKPVQHKTIATLPSLTSTDERQRDSSIPLHVLREIAQRGR